MLKNNNYKAIELGYFFVMNLNLVLFVLPFVTLTSDPKQGKTKGNTQSLRLSNMYQTTSSLIARPSSESPNSAR